MGVLGPNRRNSRTTSRSSFIGNPRRTCWILFRSHCRVPQFNLDTENGRGRLDSASRARKMTWNAIGVILWLLAAAL